MFLRTKELSLLSPPQRFWDPKTWSLSTVLTDAQRVGRLREERQGRRQPSLSICGGLALREEQACVVLSRPTVEMTEGGE